METFGTFLFIFPIVLVIFNMFFQLRKVKALLMESASTQRELMRKKAVILKEQQLLKIKKLKKAEELLDDLDDEEIAKQIGLRLSDVKKLRK